MKKVASKVTLRVEQDVISKFRLFPTRKLRAEVPVSPGFGTLGLALWSRPVNPYLHGSGARQSIPTSKTLIQRLRLKLTFGDMLDSDHCLSQDAKIHYLNTTLSSIALVSPKGNNNLAHDGHNFMSVATMSLNHPFDPLTPKEIAKVCGSTR